MADMTGVPIEDQTGVDSVVTIAYGPNIVDLVKLPDGALGLAISQGEVLGDEPASGLVCVARFEPFVDTVHALGVVLALNCGELVAADEETQGFLFDTLGDDPNFQVS